MNKKIILASASPRRKEILQTIGLDFEVIISDIDESFAHKLPPKECVKQLSLKKAQEVCKNIDFQCIIIAADTIVTIDDIILNKPQDKDDAISMLSYLQGKKHTVYTGVTVIFKNKNDPNITTYVEGTDVFMRQLSQKEIVNYVNTSEPLDKAGSYGIQGKGSLLIDSISGDYYNVVGLPIQPIQKAFLENGINIMDFWSSSI